LCDEMMYFFFFFFPNSSFFCLHFSHTYPTYVYTHKHARTFLRERSINKKGRWIIKTLKRLCWPRNDRLGRVPVVERSRIKER
jgi:hypothetical protein